jgi:hypothetical protein
MYYDSLAEGLDNAKEALSFIEQLFLSRIITYKIVYIYHTVASDTSFIPLLIDTLRDAYIRHNLAIMGF